MRLGYFIPEFPGQTHVFFWREAAALRELGAEVRLFSTRRPPPAACRHAFAAEGRRTTHYVYPPGNARALAALLARPAAARAALRYLAGLHESDWRGKLRGAGLLLCAADLVTACRRRPIDHLHVHSCADSAHVAALFHRLTGVPYSLTLHGDVPVYGRDQRSKMSAAAFVSVVTHDLQRQVVSQVGLPAERVPVIRMGVDTDAFREPEGRAGVAGRLHAATVARLAECKGHRFALRAVRELADEGLEVTYTLAGDGPDRGQVEGEIARLGLAGRVRLTGTLAEDEVRRLMQSADVFLLPSVGLGEAAPVAVMEAMACGTPPVCSIIGGTPELVSNGVDGFLTQQGNVAELKTALRALATNLELRRRLSRAARLKALRDFSHRRGGAALLDQVRRATGRVP